MKLSGTLHPRKTRCFNWHITNKTSNITAFRPCSGRWRSQMQGQSLHPQLNQASCIISITNSSSTLHIHPTHVFWDSSNDAMRMESFWTIKWTNYENVHIRVIWGVLSRLRIKNLPSTAWARSRSINLLLIIAQRVCLKNADIVVPTARPSKYWPGLRFTKERMSMRSCCTITRWSSPLRWTNRVPCYTLNERMHVQAKRHSQWEAGGPLSNCCA